ncbi:hypothetical protein KW786_01180 [Candidatus Parcubacteria bacterium]|nr:hypothetical protein [Candidatus Parcubacteria bacterium]
MPKQKVDWWAWATGGFLAAFIGIVMAMRAGIETSTSFLMYDPAAVIMGIAALALFIGALVCGMMSLFSRK